ncbi:MAG TPA: hypothetical protein VJW94_14625 [Candidatus Acidoferrum sp.]|nr:hypothetical protein [Candidatus Acidoferrum sp.]
MSIFEKASKLATNLLDHFVSEDAKWLYNRRTFYDTKQVHGFYKLVTPSGRLLEYRHRCPVTGDGPVRGPKGSVAIHCRHRAWKRVDGEVVYESDANGRAVFVDVRDVFDPDAAMPSVVRHARPVPGTARLSDGSVVLHTDAGEWDGEVGFDRSDPGF